VSAGSTGPFSIDVRVAGGDIDGLGHANNAAYVSWCEQVAWAHSASVGLDLERYRELRRAMVVKSSRFNYLAPAFAGDRLRVTTRVVACDRITATRRFEIVRESDDRELLRASIEFVCVDLDGFRPRRMPPEFVERYSAMVVAD